MAAQTLSDIQTQRRRNVKRLSTLAWDANEEILRNFFKNINGNGELLTIKQIAILNQKSADEIGNILTKLIGLNYERNRKIFYEYAQDPFINTLKFLGKKYPKTNGEPITKQGIYQLIRKLLLQMERLGILANGKEGQP